MWHAPHLKCWYVIRWCVLLPFIPRFACTQLIGPLSIGVALALMCAMMLMTLLLLRSVVAATFRVNESEGYFRFRHARLKEFSECGAGFPAGTLSLRDDLRLLSHFHPTHMH
jgi:hypothetical protein